MLLQGSQFSLSEVEVVTATVDLDAVVSYRGAGEVLVTLFARMLLLLPHCLYRCELRVTVHPTHSLRPPIPTTLQWPACRSRPAAPSRCR